MNVPDPHEVAHAAIYLSIGFEDARLADSPGEGYTRWSGDAGGGHLECMSRLVELALIQEQWLLDEGKDEFPGVFPYEFTEPLGAWLYANGDPTDTEFKAELARRWDEWLKESGL